MSDSSDGLGSGQDTSQTGKARASMSEQQGNGKLLGARPDRDVSRPNPPSKAPPAQSATRWSPPRQPIGNAKGKRL
jgi:hypothetical protein